MRSAVLLAALWAIAAPAAVVDTVFLSLKVRDFRSAHPDFGSFQGCSGIDFVEKRIGTADDTSAMAGDDRGPVLINPGECISSFESFDDWYNDKDTSVNRAFMIELPFLVDETGTMVYQTNGYYPLDDGEPYESVYDPPVPTFGQEGKVHNYSFTSEMHCTFTYFAGSGQVFSFKGDDDLWVFVNDSLVIDLSGGNTGQNAQINLDDFPAGFLQDRKTYTFDLFHAERRSSNSKVQISTSILLMPREKTLVLKAKIRDINESVHPDFESYGGCPGQGYVHSKIALTGDTSSYPGDYRTPLPTNKALSSDCFSTQANFDSWYNDLSDSVVRPFRVDIILNEIQPGVWAIGSNKFFPLDNNGAWMPFYPGGPGTFGHQTKSTHNYGFTTELHTELEYHEGAGQFFAFTGDDDLWAFVNDSLVIDLGGLHGAKSDTVFLDKLPEGFLVDGEVYPFDLFHAERHSTESNFFVTTNFRLSTFERAGIEAQIRFAASSDFTQLLSPESFLPTGDTLWIQIYDDSPSAEQDSTAVTIVSTVGDSETVVLYESESRGTYRGFVVIATGLAPVVDNGVIETRADRPLGTIYNELRVSQPSPPAVRTPSNKGVGAAAAGVRVAPIAQGVVVAARRPGTLTLYRLDGAILRRVRTEAGTNVVRMPHSAQAVILYRWQGAGMTVGGKCTTLR